MTTLTSFTPFMDLPPELRDDIWLLALPPQRVFHAAHTTSDASCPPRTHAMTFHNRPTPPTVLQVCTQARDAARRAGFIRFPQPGPTPGIWFNTRTDILYLDSDHRDALTDVPPSSSPSCDYSKVLELRLIRHIGIQWCGGSPDWSRPIESQTGDRLKAFWRAILDALAKHMPLVTTLHYMAPLVHGAEQTGLKAFPILLRPLSREARAIGFTMRSPPWGEVHARFLKVLEELEAEGTLKTKVPVILAWRLLRENPLKICYGEIRANLK
ncbi:hypothetical protein ACHAQH_004443 [Verticillium albo-atrum]